MIVSLRYDCAFFSAKVGDYKVSLMALTMCRSTIRADHYNQARSYIERIQATIPDGTVRKIAAIREQIRLI